MVAGDVDAVITDRKGSPRSLVEAQYQIKAQRLALTVLGDVGLRPEF